MGYGQGYSGRTDGPFGLPGSILWGASSTYDVGRANYGLVRFQVGDVAPLLQVLGPPEGALCRTSAPQLSVRVTDMGPGELTIGGETIAIPAGGALITRQVSLTAGDNPIVIAATDDSGLGSQVTHLLTLDETPRPPGQTVCAHHGDTDPETEGWTHSPAAVGGGTVGPVVEPPDGTIRAWNVTDPSTALDSGLGYRFDLTPEQLAAASTHGWRLRAGIRIVDSPDDPLWATLVLFRPAATFSWSIGPGSMPDGTPLTYFPVDHVEGW